MQEGGGGFTEPREGREDKSCHIKGRCHKKAWRNSVKSMFSGAIENGGSANKLTTARFCAPANADHVGIVISTDGTNSPTPINLYAQWMISWSIIGCGRSW